MNTLAKNREFQNIYNLGKKNFGYYSLIFFIKNNINENRYGFVASKKTGKAFCRNRIKRLFKEYVKNNSVNFLENYDIIFVAKKKAGENIKKIKYRDIEKDLNKIFKSAKLLKN